jgi:hypothetical protein
MRTRTVFLVVVGGCGFHASPERGDAITDVGAIADRPSDTPPGATCFGTSPSSLVTQCYLPGTLPTNTLVISTMRQIDTQMDCTAMVTSHGVQACLVTAQTITIDATVTASGSLPLVLLATGTLTVTVNGTIDVSSNRMGDGANPDASSCNPGGTGGSAGSGGGGGAGGSFGTVGGSGGTGNSTASNMGTAIAATATITLRGGCRGSSGGDGNGTNRGGTGGHAGGAVYLMAGGTLAIAGKVFASGAGGGGGQATSGGGGGGTGGLIGLDAPTITINSTTPAPQPEIVANGGAGGGGGGNNRGMDGADGTLVSTPGAIGGPPGTSPNGGAGGVGTNWSNITGGVGGAGATGAAGGGGGGGWGIIWVVGAYTNVNGDVSPESPLLH